MTKTLALTAPELAGDIAGAGHVHYELNDSNVFGDEVDVHVHVNSGESGINDAIQLLETRLREIEPVYPQLPAMLARSILSSSDDHANLSWHWSKQRCQESLIDEEKVSGTVCIIRYRANKGVRSNTVRH